MAAPAMISGPSLRLPGCYTAGMTAGAFRVKFQLAARDAARLRVWQG